MIQKSSAPTYSALSSDDLAPIQGMATLADGTAFLTNKSKLGMANAEPGCLSVAYFVATAMSVAAQSLCSHAQASLDKPCCRWHYDAGTVLARTALLGFSKALVVLDAIGSGDSVSVGPASQLVHSEAVRAWDLWNRIADDHPSGVTGDSWLPERVSAWDAGTRDSQSLFIETVEERLPKAHRGPAEGWWIASAEQSLARLASESEALGDVTPGDKTLDWHLACLSVHGSTFPRPSLTHPGGMGFTPQDRDETNWLAHQSLQVGLACGIAWNTAMRPYDHLINDFRFDQHVTKPISRPQRYRR